MAQIKRPVSPRDADGVARIVQEVFSTPPEVLAKLKAILN
jgi:hypothetical protein